MTAERAASEAPTVAADRRGRDHVAGRAGWAERTGPMLTHDQVSATADAIEACQQPDGLILWMDGGHADPWNHVESAMALASAGREAAAERAYDWLAAHQHPAGSWHNYYTAHDVKDAKIDTNCCAYVAAGVWHHWLVSGDRGFVESMWPTVARALDFVVSLRTASGHIPWAVHVDGTPWSYALLTASSSICHALRCGSALADLLGHERRTWARTLARTQHQIRRRPDGFEPKARWAMDWYYPVLCGVLDGGQARSRLAAGAPKFLLGAHGVRCVADQPWVTAAETSECALAYLRIGETTTARRLFEATSALRAPDGSYFTGWVVPQDKTFPPAERSTYSAAAVLLAADALDRRSPAADALVTAPAR
ncbi:prenyltransferase [Candidatus Poriferisodalis sp.]|uniref:prenyltransferase n=1 Tax=Candidatus Poriferisodalis sp. TaxID=3101277 RepID=UPI003B021C15